jgi:hypothetical protein
LAKQGDSAANAMWSVKILVLALLLASVKAVNRDMQHDELTGHISSTYEEIMSTRKLRKQQFGDMLEGFKDQLEKHNSGELLLTKKEFDRINNKIKVYTNKVRGILFPFFLLQLLKSFVTHWIDAPLFI